MQDSIFTAKHWSYWPILYTNHGAQKPWGMINKPSWTLAQRKEADDPCAKEQVSISYDSVFCSPRHMENTDPKYLAMDSGQEAQRRKSSVCTNSRRGIFSFLWQLCFPLGSLSAHPPHPSHPSALQELQKIQPPLPVSFSWWLLHLELFWSGNSAQLAKFEDVRSIHWHFFDRGEQNTWQMTKSLQLQRQREVYTQPSCFEFPFLSRDERTAYLMHMLIRAGMCWWLSFCASRSFTVPSSFSYRASQLVLK